MNNWRIENLDKLSFSHHMNTMVRKATSAEMLHLKKERKKTSKNYYRSLVPIKPSNPPRPNSRIPKGPGPQTVAPKRSSIKLRTEEKTRG